MCRIDRRNYKQKILIAATFFSLQWLSYYMARIITEAIYNVKAVYDAFYIAEGHMVAEILIFGGVELLDIYTTITKELKLPSFSLQMFGLFLFEEWVYNVSDSKDR